MGSNNQATASMLTPEHPRWDEFIEALSDDNVVFDLHNHLTPQAHHDWNYCKSDLRHAEEIMHRMGGIDVAGSLAFFRQHGAYCDCEIMLDYCDCTAMGDWVFDPHWGTPKQRSSVTVHASSLGLSMDEEWPAKIETSIGDGTPLIKGEAVLEDLRPKEVRSMTYAQASGYTVHVFNDREVTNRLREERHGSEAA